MRVLTVDDDTELLGLVQRALERDGHEVLACTTAEQALGAVQSFGPEIAVVDLGLPVMSGEALLAQLRTQQCPLAILVLTAQSAVSSRVRCLDLGADDYLTKPFAVAELRARVRALSRRVPRGMHVESYVRDPVALDFSARRATLRGEEAPITSREWAILELLASRVGEVVERRDIIERVWGQPEDAGSAASLEVLVGRIRRKLDPHILRTVRGQGYVLEKGTGS